jgi:hypothetical protein
VIVLAPVFDMQQLGFDATLGRWHLSSAQRSNSGAVAYSRVSGAARFGLAVQTHGWAAVAKAFVRNRRFW